MLISAKIIVFLKILTTYSLQLAIDSRQLRFCLRTYSIQKINGINFVPCIRIGLGRWCQIIQNVKLSPDTKLCLFPKLILWILNGQLLTCSRCSLRMNTPFCALHRQFDRRKMPQNAPSVMIFFSSQTRYSPDFPVRYFRSRSKSLPLSSAKF